MNINGFAISTQAESPLAGSWAVFAHTSPPTVNHHDRNMPLTKCPSCGNEVSPKAAACPKCGHQFRYPGSLNLSDPVHLLAIIVLIVIFILVALGGRLPF